MLCVFVAVAARERGPAGVTRGTTAPERTAQAIVTTSAAAAASSITAADQLVCKNTRFCDRACCIFRKRLHLLFPRTTLFMISRVLQSL